MLRCSERDGQRLSDQNLCLSRKTCFQDGSHCIIPDLAGLPASMHACMHGDPLDKKPHETISHVHFYPMGDDGDAKTAIYTYHCLYIFMCNWGIYCMDLLNIIGLPTPNLLGPLTHHNNSPRHANTHYFPHSMPSLSSSLNIYRFRENFLPVRLLN